jgi:hypothetical protein
LREDIGAAKHNTNRCSGRGIKKQYIVRQDIGEANRLQNRCLGYEIKNVVTYVQNRLLGKDIKNARRHDISALKKRIPCIQGSASEHSAWKSQWTANPKRVQHMHTQQCDFFCQNMLLWNPDYST